MADKTGQTKQLPITLQTAAGSPVTYASAAAFLAAGWSVVYEIGGVAVTPTYTWTVVSGSLGRHEIGLTLQYGNGTFYIVPPTGYVCNVEAFILDTETNSIDSIAGLVSAGSGASSADGSQSTFAYSTEESDGFARTLTVPAAALTNFGFSDLSWVTGASAAGRHAENRLWPSPDFTLNVDITDAANRQVTIGWGGFPTGASISGGTITGVSTGSKTFTIAGDKRAQFRGVTQLKVWGSTANDGTYTPVSVALVGGNTVVTVSETPASAVADGTIAQAADSRDFDVDVQFTGPKSFAVTGVSTGSKTFTIAGAYLRFFTAGDTITISGSTGNDGTYTVASVALTGGNTVVTVNEAVASAVADGTLKATVKVSPLRVTLTVARQEVRT